jgi:hypothetical protein
MTIIKSCRDSWFCLGLAGVASLIVLSLTFAGTPPAASSRVSWPESRATQLVFFAVLEGLYRDGVANQDIDLIVPPGTNGQPTFYAEHFVYACPLCHPAFEAFRLYRQRKAFFGMKVPVDTLGPGLEPALAAALRSPQPRERRDAIERLINRWVRQRLDMMRLSDAEREAITRELEQGRKQGMSALKQGTQSRTNCPICDGSFGACKVPMR